MRLKPRLLVLLALLTACGGNPVQQDLIGDRTNQSLHLVEVRSANGEILVGAEIVGQNTVSTNMFGIAHVSVNPSGRTTLEARARGYRSGKHDVSRPARSADDVVSVIRLDPLP